MSADWWRGAVIYHVYPLSFCDGNGDGLGDLPGMLSRLDYIAELGVDAIWMSPFFPSPMKDFGYDVTDYCNVDPAMGTLADFDAIVKRTHALGLKVMIDQVWSHTSDQHPWFLESRSARDTATADWYVWADAKPDGNPPNNWLSVFGGSAWTWNPLRRQYYLHHFLPNQPALNLRHEAVASALLASGRFWLERGVDGFRFDAVDFMFHDSGLRDNPPRPPADGLTPARPFRLQYHHHDMMGPETHGFLARIRALVDEYDGTVTLGEVSSEDGALERCVAYTEAPAGTPDSGLHMAYTLGLMKRNFGPDLFRDAIAAAGCTDATGLCWAFSNHDVERVVSRWGGARSDSRFARLLMSLLLSLPGTVCLYQGEELGLPQAKIPASRLRDPFGAAFHPVFPGRDGSRTPMPWTAAARHAGFTTARQSWLPVPRTHRPRAVDRQQADPRSLLHIWREFLSWRRSHPALTHGKVRGLRIVGSVLAFERYVGNSRILAAFNLDDQPATLNVDCWPALTPLGGYGFSAGRVSGTVRLHGHSAFFARIHEGSATGDDHQDLMQAAD